MTDNKMREALAALPTREEVLGGQRYKYVKLHEVLDTVDALSAQASAEPVGYLDIGAGGYIDIGSDLGDEELMKLPKGRHMLGIVGTYGVDGYVQAPPRAAGPVVPERLAQRAKGWLRAFDAPSGHIRSPIPLLRDAESIMRALLGTSAPSEPKRVEMTDVARYMPPRKRQQRGDNPATARYGYVRGWNDCLDNIAAHDKANGVTS